MITVIKAPPFATVQDLGRPGHLSAAVPRAGALDPFAHSVANLLVGNPRTDATIEWGVAGGEVRFERDTVIALAGATARATVGGRPATPNRAERVRAGDSLTIERIEAGAWMYLAVSGGIAVAPVLGSRATYLPGQFGGLEGRLLRAGDRLPLGTAQPGVLPAVPRAGLGPADEARRPASRDPASTDADEPIALLPGPDRALAPDAWHWLLESEFRISRAISRMGYRLDAPRASFSSPGDRPSAPACPGTVQLPPGADPIVLMPDGPTVGGYVRLAVVATADLGRLAQLTPGATLRFRAIDLQAARTRLRRQEEALSRLSRPA